MKHFDVGVDLGGTNVRAGLVGSGKILALASKRVRAGGTRREVFEDLCAVIDEVSLGRRVRGIGVGVPSLVDQRTGKIFDTTNIPAWSSVPLRAWLEKRYACPVVIDNDANCFALGERYFGFGRECENFVGLVCGTGLGSGIISRGRLHSGRSSAAGEFGMIPYRGKILEAYVSGQFFEGRGEELARAARAGNRKALRQFQEFGQHFGRAIELVLYSLAPEMIILGGAVGKSYPLFAPQVKAELANFAFPSVARKCKIKVSRLKHVAVLGAASLLADQIV